MKQEVIIALVVAIVAVIGAIGSVLLLSFRIGSLVGRVTSFMEASGIDSRDLRADLTKLGDRLSMHIEHHGRPTP